MGYRTSVYNSTCVWGEVGQALKSDRTSSKQRPSHPTLRSPIKEKTKTPKRYTWKQLISFFPDPFRSRHDNFAIIFSKFCMPKKMTPKSRTKIKPSFS